MNTKTWNVVLTNKEKEIICFDSFKNKQNSKIFNLENEFQLFSNVNLF